MAIEGGFLVKTQVNETRKLFLLPSDVKILCYKYTYLSTFNWLVHSQKLYVSPEIDLPSIQGTNQKTMAVLSSFVS